MQSKKEVFKNLESLRGIAAISVALFHFKIGSHFNNEFTTNAGVLVDFFFVLSGFVIYYSYHDKLRNFQSLILFQKKRFLRLYPLHLLMLGVFLLIELAKYIFESQTGIISNKPAFEINNFQAFVANMLLLQNWTIPRITFNDPSWSISAEFYTYLLFGLIVYIIKSKKFLLLIFLILFIPFMFFNISGHMLETSNIWGPARCTYSFAIGSFASYIYLNFNFQNRISNSYTAVLLLSLCYFLVSKYGDAESWILTSLPLVFGLVVFVLVATDKNTTVNKLLSINVLVYLGKISYGIYMIHYAVWWVTIQVLRFIVKVPTTTRDDGRTAIVIDNVYLADFITLLGFCFIILLAHLSFFKFELRFRADKT